MKNFIIGVEMTEKELLGAFERNGLKKIHPAQGDKFDPHLHQAVMEQPSTEVAAGGVITVLQAGYELMGRLVRPAMVAVAAKGSTGPGGPEQAGASANPYAGAGDMGVMLGESAPCSMLTAGASGGRPPGSAAGAAPVAARS